MDNLFVKNINLGCENSNHFLYLKNFFEARTYYVTTKKSEKKYYNTMLRSYGLKPEKIYAVPACKKTSTLNIQEYSYLDTWKSVMENEKENYVIMLDDDIRFSHNFSIYLARFLTSVPKNWDILYLGASQHEWQDVEIQNNYYEAHNTKGSFALFLSPNAVQKISEKLQKTDYTIPLDEILNKMHLNKYVSYPNLIISDVAESSIRKPRNIIKHAAKMHWDLSYYDYFKYLRIKVLFVVNTKNCNQSYDYTTYFYVNSEANIKDNPTYEKEKRNHQITLVHIKKEDPSHFYVEKEIKFVLKTET